MPFITEELYHALKKRSENDSIMVSLLPQAGIIDTTLLTAFDNAKEIIAGIRTIRLQKNIPNKEFLELQIMNEQQVSLPAVILKIANLSKIEIVKDKASGASSFMVGTIEYAVPLGKMIDAEVEIKKLNDELNYQQGFLTSIEKKLSNEKFVANAKPEVVEMERKKLADAKSKIVSIKEAMAALKTL
jgi:valyl-tRNA synthetase